MGFRPLTSRNGAFGAGQFLREISYARNCTYKAAKLGRPVQYYSNGYAFVYRTSQVKYFQFGGLFQVLVYSQHLLKGYGRRQCQLHGAAEEAKVILFVAGCGLPGCLFGCGSAVLMWDRAWLYRTGCLTDFSRY